jgi:hypothetical protein
MKIIGFKANGLVYVGRWIVYACNGQFLHNNIIQSSPVCFEVLIVWSVHYFVGISFAFLLIKLFGQKWLNTPSLLQALSVALLSMLIPVFLLQHAFGFGVAFNNMPNQAVLLLRFVAIHAVYGFGLFLSARIVNLTRKQIAPSA